MAKVLKCGDIVPRCKEELKAIRNTMYYVELPNTQRRPITWTVFRLTFCRR